MIELKGIIGIGKKVIVDGDNVKIHLGVLNTNGMSREKTISIKNIVSVQVKKAGLTSGYIYFQTIGGMDNLAQKNFTDVLNDENSVTFNSGKKYKVALEIKKYIEEKQNNQNYHHVTIENSGSVGNADELRKYKKLLDDGIITKEEFEQKKKQLLGL